jgi:hypothetical protein
VRKRALGIAGLQVIALAGSTLVIGFALPAAVAAGASARTITLHGVVRSLSVDGPNAAAKTSFPSGGKTCNTAAVWRGASDHVMTLGKPECAGRTRRDLNVANLTIAGNRVVWTRYEFGNDAYCTAMLTATLAAPKPHDLGICDGSDGNEYYDFAGQGALLVTREYTVCEVDCGFDYTFEGEAYITLYQVTSELTQIGPLENDTHLWDVDSGRLLLAHEATLEVVTPNDDANAVFISAPKAASQAFLSGDTVLAVTGKTLTGYDATTGTQTASRSLEAGAKVDDFSDGLVVYTVKRQIHLLRLADSRDRRVRTVKGLVAAQLDLSGLFYAANSAGSGHLTFIPSAALSRLLTSGA